MRSPVSGDLDKTPSQGEKTVAFEVETRCVRYTLHPCERGAQERDIAVGICTHPQQEKSSDVGSSRRG